MNISGHVNANNHKMHIKDILLSSYAYDNERSM